MNSEIIAAILGGVFLLAVTFLTLWNSRQQKAQEDLGSKLKANDDITRRHDAEISALREQVKYLPSTDSISRLHNEVNQIGREVSEVKGGQRAQTEMLSYLLGDRDSGPRRAA